MLVSCYHGQSWNQHWEHFQNLDCSLAHEVSAKVCQSIFLVFEGLCGCFFPTFGTLRGTYIPEKQRTTVMNLFRVPLNLYVVVLLQQMKTWEVSSAFMLIAMTHGACLVFYQMFQKSVNKDFVKYESVEGVDNEEDFGAVEDGDAGAL